jgi:type IV pilus assembly protein PilM
MDDTRVRVMVTRGRRISRLADLPLESSLAAINTKEKEIELGRKIHHLLKINKISQRKIILGVSGLHCLTRPVALPELPKAMLGEAVIREARRVLPMPLEQLYLSWQIISVADGKTNIFMVALPRQITDMVIRVINHAGCKPYLMEIKPMALARLSPEPTAIILDVQPNEFDIVIMINGIPQPVRTIAFPQETLPFADKLVIIKEETKRTLEFVKAKPEGNQITPDTTMYVSGELAEHPECFEVMAGEFKLKTVKLALPLKYPKNLDPLSYLVNAGLALKEMSREARPLKPNFNALPAPFLPKHISLSKLMALPAAACAIALLVLMTFALQDAATEIRTLQNRVDMAASLILKKQTQKVGTTDSLATLKLQKTQAEAEYEQYAAAFKNLMTTGNNMNTDLNASVDNIQTGLLVTSLSITDSQITITGSADSEEAVFKYVRDLTETGRFQEITIVNIIRADTNEKDEDGAEMVVVSYNYTLSCSMKEGQ